MPLAAGARDTCSRWLRLILTPGLGPAGVRHLLEAFGLPEDVLAAGHSRLSAALDPILARALLADDPTREAAVQAALAWAEAPGHHLLTLEDPRYPARLLQIGDPPPVLFVRGDPARLARPSLAIVGSRSATQSGLATARDFARALAEAGLTVVSGLARGIDAAAHQGALDTRAGTVAVVGTGIDLVYPAGHAALADAIAANGALVSELALGTPVQRSGFPRRNRLIAGLTLGTLVVEAARLSGSLITARQAAEAGREVMAVPGSIHSPLAKGCHELIRQGAKLVESAEDVLDELRVPLAGPGRPHAARAGKAAPNEPAELAVQFAAGSDELADLPCSGDAELAGGLRPEDEEAAAERLLLAAMGFDPVDVDELIDRTRRPAGELGALLLRLELAGRVERLADGRFARLPQTPRPGTRLAPGGAGHL